MSTEQKTRSSSQFFLDEAASPTPAAVQSAAQISSDALLGPRGELVIEHRGRAYRLRITQSGKLILTA